MTQLLDLGSEFAEGYKIGQTLKAQREEMARAQEDQDFQRQQRKIQLDILDHQRKGLKIEDALQQFRALQGQRAQETQIGQPGTSTPAPVTPDSGPTLSDFQQSLPQNVQDILQRPVAEQPSPVAQGFTKEQPLPSVTVPFEAGPVTMQPQSLQDLTRQTIQQKIADKQIDKAFAPPFLIPKEGTAIDQSTGKVIATGAPGDMTPDERQQALANAKYRFDKKLTPDATLTKAQEADARLTWDQLMKENPEATADRRTNQANMQSDRENARVDRSYQFHIGEVGKLAKPVDDTVSRMGRLQDTLDQNTPQADALVAPELLSVMTGGQGSGLRMNDSEISRIVGGRSNWESLHAAIDKWSTDPKAANSITPSQRQQIRALAQTVQTKLLAKQQALTDAQQRIIDAPNVNEHRQALADAKKTLGAIDSGQSQPPAKLVGPNGTVLILGADGKYHASK